ncbi:DNA polymerase III subunit delta' C-terminal domain-containing protein [Legionella worsleiensis]|uniref:DNA polymerase III subunit delta' n=1 Tax=Legionella worsleiensis TaxID=45076 RepID=A0A0W1AJM1_9GAMM|nr:DNA polymerase III subunit delta' [Legionella worsleiensis]KTD81454.1 DNA polymerase III subunit delta' [Legionella worsleiensis]STY30173.1 DNA polymerase III, delta prime subunit [Legionella worsleiensis]
MNHCEQWQKIQAAFAQQRMPQSLLLVGPLHCGLESFVKQIMSLVLCQSEHNKPCLSCSNCQMVARMEHPDVEWIKPEKNGGAIKIDQIRELHRSAYLTPQRADYRLIVIESADRMNTASANALLKILEEPAQHVVFILMAEQLSTILPTVLSRCQILTFSGIDDSDSTNLLSLGTYYAPDSDRAVVFRDADVILDGLIALLERKQHPCSLASAWTHYELGSFLWFLYLVYSQIQIMHIKKHSISEPASQQLNRLVPLVSPLLLFRQIDKINTLLKKISHNMNVNQTLALEDLLFSLGADDLTS